VNLSPALRYISACFTGALVRFYSGLRTLNDCRPRRFWKVESSVNFLKIHGFMVELHAFHVLMHGEFSVVQIEQKI
jgi:hypothetical protein